MKSISMIIKILLLFTVINISLSGICSGSFEEINSYDLKELKVSKDNEVCLKYKLKDKKSSIALEFKLANCYTGEVLIYRAESDSEEFESYFLAKNPFKEIVLSDFTDYVFIVIKDTSKYYFNDYLTLYDAEEPITLKEGEPFTITKFMSNQNYFVQFLAGKTVTVAMTMKSNIDIKVNLNFGEITEEHNTEFYKEYTLENLDKANLNAIITKLQSEEDEPTTEISFVVYDRAMKEVKKLNINEATTTYYIYNSETQYFYYYADISDFKNSGTVNLKLDYRAVNYTKISSKVIIQDEEITNFDEYLPESTDLLPSGYDPDSDEYYKIYFHDDSNKKYKYIIIGISIKPSEFIEPNQFTISVSKQVEEMNLKDIENNVAREIKNITNNYIPVYTKLLLDTNSKYLLTTPYQENLLLIKGDILISDFKEINKDYINKDKDITILSDMSEVTIRISGYQFEKSLYIEKLSSEDVEIKEETRTDDVITIQMTSDYCSSNKRKYIIGNYNKDKYSHGTIIYTVYGTVPDYGKMELYYKNTLDLDDKSIFPSSASTNKELEKVFLLNSNIDLFSIKCTEPGTMYIRPFEKRYDLVTHVVRQNSIETFTMESEEEIIQLSSPIKDKTVNVTDYIYLSILSLLGNEITLTPLTEGIISYTTIKGDELFTQAINIDKFKTDELTIKIKGEKGAYLEVVEVSPMNFTTYEEIKDYNKKKLTKNNFVKFINRNIKQVDLKVEGLENVDIAYGIVELPTNDINYLPPAYKFSENVIRTNISKSQNLEVINNYFEKENNKKNYIALIFSIFTSKTDFVYEVQFIDNSSNKDNNNDNDNEESNLLMNILLFVSIFVVLFIVIITIIIIRRKKGINVENISNNKNMAEQPLYPSSGESEDV